MALLSWALTLCLLAAALFIESMALSMATKPLFGCGVGPAYVCRGPVRVGTGPILFGTGPTDYGCELVYVSTRFVCVRPKTG